MGSSECQFSSPDGRDVEASGGDVEASALHVPPCRFPANRQSPVHSAGRTSQHAGQPLSAFVAQHAAPCAFAAGKLVRGCGLRDTRHPWIQHANPKHPASMDAPAPSQSH